MTSSDRLIWAKTLLLRIHVITGWNLPADDLMSILVDQFDKKIVESYPNVNPDEVEYAFRNSRVKEWGKQLNISLIDEAMQEYLEARLAVSRIEEQRKTQLAQIAGPKEDISDAGMDAFWDSTQKLVVKVNYPVNLIPPGLYEWMDKNGNILLTREDKFKYLERATLARNSELSTNYEKNPHNLGVKEELSAFNRMRASGKIEGVELERIKALSKKMIVFDMMKTGICSQA